MTPAVRVAYQGESGAFSDEAIDACFGADAALGVPRPNFGALVQAVESGDVDFGMLPVENSIAGSVTAALDALSKSDVSVIGEIIRPIRLCLLGVPGSDAAGLRRVLSHPVALAQCQRFLAGLTGAEAIAVHDTAGAARMIADAGDAESGAVAGRGAAVRYGLTVLAENIQDRSDNQTRFFVLALPGTPAPWSDDAARPRRTALLLETQHRAGALVDALTAFSSAGISLTRIESRPGDEPWHYRFFLEIDADTADPVVADAIAEAKRRSNRLRVFGSFPRLGS
ncbi:MAG: prephenate dehydratase [Gemmatimonadota bacterium]